MDAPPNTPGAQALSPADGQPNLSGLSSDLDTSPIDQQYDPQITSERESAQHYEEESIKYSEKGAEEGEKAAAADPAQNQVMDDWLKSQPTRSAAYATVMHTAPMLALLSAIGGKVTKLSGQNMLAATNGIVQGMNSASEKTYEDSYNHWMQEYQKLRQHQDQLQKQHQIMLEAYHGRADAYQKAADSARRMTGDLIDQKQQAVNAKIHSFQAQSQAMDRLSKAKYALEQLHERQRHDIQQESHWKETEERIKSGKVPPALAQQIKAEHEQWANAKAQIDELMKQRGQVNANLGLSEDAKAQMLQRIDDQAASLTMSMDESVARSKALASQADPATPGKASAAPAAAPNPNNPNTAAPGTDQTAQVSPAKKQALEQHKGQPVSFGDGSQWILDSSGSVRMLKPPQQQQPAGGAPQPGQAPTVH